MKKAIIFFISFGILLFSAFPLDVDVNELKNTGGKTIEFINYTGENPRFTADEIRSWGARMAKELETGKDTGYYYNFFSIIHVVDPAVKEKFDADIMTISKFGGVNHIDSLRLILQGFFQQQYGYTLDDAKTLAFFVTIYNAVHRGDITYLDTKYKQKVMGYLDATDAGLAINYREWPGKTKILIPLSEDAKKGDLGSLNMDELTEKQTTDVVKKEDDKGIDEREDMVDLKERVIEEEKGKLEEDKTKLEEDKKKLEEEKKQLEEDKKKLEEEKKDAEKITDDTKKKEAEDKIKEEEKKITEEEKKIKEDEKKITEDEKKIAEDEKKVEDKTKTLEEEKKDLEKDKLVEEIKKDTEGFVDKYIEEKKNEDEKVYKGKFYYLKVKEFLTMGHYNNEMFIIDAPTGDIVIEAEEKNICGRKYDINESGVVVISHAGSHTAGHYLTLLDLNTLKVIKKGKDNVFHRSLVEVKNNFIYAISMEKDKYYLTKYNMNLEEVGRSTEPVYMDTLASFYQDRVYVNGENKEILALSTRDLSLIEKITP